MDYTNYLSNNNATTENPSDELDLTLRIRQPINISNQQEESRDQVDNVDTEQYKRMNVGQGNLNYMNPGHLNYVHQFQYNSNYVNQGHGNFVNHSQNNYVNPQLWMTFPSPTAPSESMIPSTSFMPNSLIRAFGPFPQPAYQPKSEIPERTCSVCKTTRTPMWRKGPDGIQTLCNACGLRLARITRKGN